MPIYDFQSASLPDSFVWLNEPQDYFFEDGLWLVTQPQTDFWQRTHYGFERDDGHCLLTTLAGDFTIATRTQFAPLAQYDQCGLMARLDRDNWIKCSTEYESPSLSRLGSVVTNLGFSDWATQDVTAPVRSVSYRLSKRGQDFLIEYALDNSSAETRHEQMWHQMRIAHLHQPIASIEVGIYACSPVGKGFRCHFDFIQIEESAWSAPPAS